MPSVRHAPGSFQAGPGGPPAPSQTEWLRLAEDVVGAALLRADAHRNLLSIARCLGWAADWRTSRTRPTLARLIDVSGLSRRCVQNWLRWLEQRGLLRVTEPGTTPQFRPGLLRCPDSGNLAREWLLSRPVDVTCTPTGSDLDLDEVPTRARARETGAETGTPEVKGAAPLAAVPENRAEALAAARAMQERAGLLRRISAEHLRHLARPFFAAGWSPLDVLHALDHAPDGRQHGYTSPVRHVPGWLAARLAGWLGPDEVPLPSRGQHLAEGRREVLAEQAARRARDADARARAADYPVQAARAREMLARRRAVA